MLLRRYSIGVGTARALSNLLATAWRSLAAHERSWRLPEDSPHQMVACWGRCSALHRSTPQTCLAEVLPAQCLGWPHLAPQENV